MKLSPCKQICCLESLDQMYTCDQNVNHRASFHVWKTLETIGHYSANFNRMSQDTLFGNQDKLFGGTAKGSIPTNMIISNTSNPKEVRHTSSQRTAGQTTAISDTPNALCNNPHTRFRICDITQYCKPKTT